MTNARTIPYSWSEASDLRDFEFLGRAAEPGRPRVYPSLDLTRQVIDTTMLSVVNRVMEGG